MIDHTSAGVDDAGHPAPAAPPPSQPEQTDPAAAAGVTFEQLGLRAEVLSALTTMGFARPMEVQRVTFRPIMEGRDLLVQSRTGSGKTAAFGIPFAQKLVDAAQPHVQALCLCPTRELALQVGAECGRIGEACGLQVAAIYGGAPMGKQIEQLKAGAQIVAGTPGRVLDHLRRGTLKLDGLKVLVLDEADEMLSMGFYEEISEILKRCPTDRQTLLFSATIPEEIERISKRHMRDPEKIVLSADYVGVAEIHHAYYMVSGMGRARDLVRILAVEKPETAIIFCNTREETNFVAEHLRREGHDAEAISSDLSQSDRERVMGRMRARNLKFLVATDIAARGIDISDLSHVFNYTFPESAEVYVHRTGRTGRAGKSGTAISLISPRELGNFYYLKLTYKIRPEERTLPSDEEIASRRDGERIERLARELGAATPPEEWRSLARRLWSSGQGEAQVALLLERYLQGSEPRREERVPVAAPSSLEAPSPTGSAAPARLESRGEERSHGGRRDEGRRGGRGGRERERERGRGGREREREPRRESGRPPARASSERPAEQPRAEATKRQLPGSPIIEATDGREFWEAWVDDHQNAAPRAPGASPVDEAAPPRAGDGNGESRPRGERRPPRVLEELPPGAVRLYLGLGRRDNLGDDEVAQIVAEKGVPVQKLELHNSHTYLVVAEHDVDGAVSALNGLAHNGRTVACERARR